MVHPKWYLAGLAAMSLVVVGVTARTTVAKQQPPPPPPTIVAVVQGGPFFRAVASDGTVYDIADNYPAAQCGQALTRAVVVGRMFMSPPVSPISAAYESSRGLVVTLENGDAWVLNESCCTPGCYGTGTFMGNVFTVAGASASELAPQSAAPASRITLRNTVGGAYPNPAHGPIRITYTTAEAGPDVIRVFDATGRLIRTLQSEHGAPGSYSVGWDGRDEQGSRVASGAYFYQVRYGDGSVGSKSMVLAR